MQRREQPNPPAVDRRGPVGVRAGRGVVARLALPVIEPAVEHTAPDGGDGLRDAFDPRQKRTISKKEKTQAKTLKKAQVQ